jgi:hypothetical protein
MTKPDRTKRAAPITLAADTLRVASGGNIPSGEIDRGTKPIEAVGTNVGG